MIDIETSAHIAVLRQMMVQFYSGALLPHPPEVRESALNGPRAAVRNMVLSEGNPAEHALEIQTRAIALMESLCDDILARIAEIEGTR